jgi:hypothetical protein
MSSFDHESIITMAIIFVAAAGLSYLRLRGSAGDRPRWTVRETTPSGKETVRLPTRQEAWKLGGRTRLSWLRTWRTLVGLLLGIAVLVIVSIGEPVSLVALVSGTAVGVCIGIYALRLTTFEATPTGLYYTPRLLPSVVALVPIVVYIGVRFGYRAVTADGTGPRWTLLLNPLDPLVLLCAGPLFGYFVSYNIGLLRWRRTVRASSNRAVFSED